MTGYKKYNVNQLCDIAKSQINHLDKDQEFKVRDLFVGMHWDKLDNTLRRNLGRRVLEETLVDGSLAGIIEPVRKNSAGQQIYKKSVITPIYRKNDYPNDF